MQKLIAERETIVQQIATAIETMNRDEQRRLLDLSPSLLRLVQGANARTLEQATENVDRLKKRLRANAGQSRYSRSDPFLGGLTWGQYDALSEKEKDALWSKWEEIDLENMRERDVNPDALFA